MRLFDWPKRLFHKKETEVPSDLNASPPQTNKGVSSDRPLKTIADDSLNRASFAQRVGTLIEQLPHGASIVIGIHGPWGDGKTTVLNFVHERLKTSETSSVLEFNPWRYADEAAMLTGFFKTLAETIQSKLTTSGEDLAARVKEIGKYAAVLHDRFGKAADIASELSQPGLEELRDRLSDALSKNNKRIIVLIDDIDRLDKHETFTLFRLIKATVDFPNVSYVLAFDDKAVAKALGEKYGAGDESSGRAFLEKIIQVPLKLPTAAKEDLRRLCLEEIDKCLRETETKMDEEQIREFLVAFDEDASSRLITPRAAKRFSNGLMFVLPMLIRETNPVDLLLLEALRAFYPEVYDVVRENHTNFSGVDQERLGERETAPRYSRLLDPVFAVMKPEHSEGAKKLLVKLFPRLNRTYGSGSVYPSSWLDSWTKDKRASSPDYCPRYFMYGVPRNDVPDTQISLLLEAARDQNLTIVESMLSTYLTELTTSSLISKLRSVETSIDPVAAQTLSVNLAARGGNFPLKPALFDATEPGVQAAILISYLLQRVNAGSLRVQAAKQVIQNAEPLWFAGECLRWMYVSSKPEEQRYNTWQKRNSGRSGASWLTG